MKALGWTNWEWVLALILGLTGASCTTQVTTDRRPPTTDHRLLTASEPDVATKATIQAAYGKLPLSFEANQGQSNEQVKFFSRGSGYTLFLTPTEAVLALHKPEPKAKGKGQRPVLSLVEGAKGKREEQEKIDLAKLETQNLQLKTVVRMKLVGANPSPQVVGLDELPGKSNYFIGNDPKKWRTNIPTYAKVKYESIYPGVDLVFYGNQRQLEYDFIVAPGADPKAIQLAFEGLVPAQKGRTQGSPLQIDTQGDLILHTAGSEIRLHRPRIYQEINGVKQPIPGGYVLPSPQSSSLITFHVAAYDTSRPLIIDPALSYSTYLGGGDTDEGFSIAVDSSGNAYVIGYTYSTDFPTASPLQATCGSCSIFAPDAFVTKLDATGSALVYSTYLGGSGVDRGKGIAVDSSGNAYVTGWTDSTNFPTASPLQATYGGGTDDAFVAKINAAGTALVYSTYLGGSSNDTGIDIAVDPSSNAYVVGYTSSTNFPTASPIQATYGGGTNDAFVAKFNAAGSALVYSTYLGGSSSDGGYSIAVDSSGSAYVMGWTDSTNFPTASPLQVALGGWGDAFVAKFNAAGSALVYSTYLGGSSSDGGYSIAVDSSGNAYVTGWTDSTNFPTANPLQPAFGGGEDAFVAKLNAAGSALIYSTYLSGSGYDESTGIAVDSSGNAYVTGSTWSSDFPTASPFQTSNAGTIDAFVAKLNAAGSALVYSTYLGGSRSDGGSSIAVDSSGSAYVMGWTDSTNFPTASPFQAAFAGSSDAFVAKIADTTCTYSISPTSQTFSASGGTGSVSVTAPSGCSWTAMSNASWITITSGSSGSGNGTVSYTVAANTSTSSRMGTLTIAGQTFTVTQEGEGGPVCPATAALEGDLQKETKLELLYDFRDEVLASTPAGQRYIELYYKHAEEGVGLMFSYPELLSHTYMLLEHFLPTIQAVVAGREVTVTLADVADVEALLEAFAAKASPALRADLRVIQEKLWQGTLLDQFGIVVQ